MSQVGTGGVITLASGSQDVYGVYEAVLTSFQGPFLPNDPLTFPISSAAGKVTSYDAGQALLKFTIQSATQPNVGELLTSTGTLSGTISSFSFEPNFLPASAGDLLVPRHEVSGSYDLGSIETRSHIKLTSQFVGTSALEADFIISNSFTPNQGYPYAERGDSSPAEVFKRAIIKIDQDFFDGNFSSGDFSTSLTVSGVPVSISSSGGNPWNQFFHVVDEKAADVDGGTFTSGSWQTRTLNTVLTNEISGASLSSNQITLPAGDYYIEARAPAVFVRLHKAKLRDITAGSDALIGSSCHIQNADDSGSTDSVMSGKLTVSSSTTYEVQHRCSDTRVTFGFGIASNFGVVERYAEVRIWKLDV